MVTLKWGKNNHDRVHTYTSVSLVTWPYRSLLLLNINKFRYNTRNKNRQVRLLDKDRFGSWPCWSNVTDGYLYWHKNRSNWGYYSDWPFGLNTRTYGFLMMNKPHMYSNIYSKYIVKMRTFKQLHYSINETVTKKIHVHYSTAQRRLCLLKLNLTLEITWIW